MILTLPELKYGDRQLRQHLVVLARSEGEELHRQLLELTQLEEQLFETGAATRPWDPPRRKRRLWELQDLLPVAEQAVDQQVQLVLTLYESALQQDGDDARLRAELADLCWKLLGRAEERGEHRAAERYMQALQRHDDGRYADLVEGTGTLTIRSEPDDVRVRLHRLVERDRRLVSTERRELGRTPLGPVDLAPGRYLVELRLPRHAPAIRPLRVRRGEDHGVQVNLFALREVGPDFVQVSAGRFSMGGDRRAANAARPSQPFVDNFALARYPVTVGEYLLFLDDLAGRDPARALRYTPRQGTRPSADPRLPVTGIDLEAAEAYCEWLSARSGIAHRLPTEQEWEKAARGVDGRSYPWGDRFDPSLCHMRDAFVGEPMLRPAGGFSADESVYGAREMAGGISEWTASPFDHAAELQTVRGGSFQNGPDGCRVARRLAVERTARLPYDTVSPPTVPSVAVTRTPRRPMDPAVAWRELLAAARELAGLERPMGMRAVVARVVQLVQAERGLVVERGEGQQLQLRAGCTAAGEAIPSTDQRFDAEVALAAMRQRRTIDVWAGRPLIASPLAGGHGCLLLERRFSGSAFSESDRLVAQAAADLLSVAARLGGTALPPADRGDGQSLEEAVAALERQLVAQALSEEQGNISRTARRLGLSRNGLRARLRRYGLVDK
jgi:formylglycine-generating enzyme required for sulfatase activity